MPLWTSSRIKRVPLKNTGTKRSGFVKILVWAVLISAIGFYIFNSSLLDIQDIKITGIEGGTSSDVNTHLQGALKDEKLYAMERGYVTSLINEKFPNLKLNEIKYEFPNKFEINLSQREQKYQIYADNGIFVADEEGFVLSQTNEASESVDLDVIYDKSLEVGKKVEDISLQAALVYAELNQSIKIEDDQIHLNLENGGKVILPQNDAVSKVADFYTLLQKIIQKYSIDNRQIEFIDLRFSKPVIKYVQ